MRTDKDSKDNTEYKISSKLFNKKRKKSDSTEDTLPITPEKKLKRMSNRERSSELSSGMDTDTEIDTKIKDNIKNCTINLNRIATPATITNRVIRNSNDDNLDTVQNKDHNDDNLNYEFDPSSENDPPNNCYTPEDFCQNYQGLGDIINTVIELHQETNKPFEIANTIADGTRTGTWAMNDFQGKYIISKLGDNNRILVSKKIETLYFYHKERNVNNQNVEKQKEDDITDENSAVLQEQPAEDNIPDESSATLQEQSNTGENIAKEMLEDKEDNIDEDNQIIDVKPVEKTPIMDEA